jgi:hypothetical protein
LIGGPKKYRYRGQFSEVAQHVIVVNWCCMCKSNEGESVKKKKKKIFLSWAPFGGSYFFFLSPFVNSVWEVMVRENPHFVMKQELLGRQNMMCFAPSQIPLAPTYTDHPMPGNFSFHYFMDLSFHYFMAIKEN